MLSGFLVIDKQKGITSFDVVRLLRKITGVKKIGHLGTLDPMATGVLVVAIGEATKLIEYLMKLDKSYVGEVTLGKVSDTFDAEGELSVMPGVVEKGIKFKQSDVEKVLKENFLGIIKQVPPKYSALKIGGKKAYELARSGVEVEMKSREVEVKRIEVVEFDLPKMSLEIDCGSGTYIRSIAHDLGQVLGCGGFLSALRRTKVGEFEIKDAFELRFETEVKSDGRKFLLPVTELSEIEESLLPVSVGVKGMSVVECDEEEKKCLVQGKFIDNRFELEGLGAGFFGGDLFAVLETVEGGRSVKIKKGIGLGL